MPERGDMTVREAGKRGGEATFRKHGSEHYERIGQVGGRRAGELIRRGIEAEREERCLKSES